MTSRGIPNIYYGTEQYVTSEDSSDVAGRIFMQTDCSFDTSTTAYSLIKELSDLRQENEAIAYGTTTILYSDDNVVVYERQFYDDIVVVAVNRQPDQTYTVPAIETALSDGTYNDYLDGMLYGGSINVSSTEGKTMLDAFELSGGEVCVWSYNAEEADTPQIGDVVSTMGRAGNTVYIYGDGLDGNVTVKFGEVEADITSAGKNMIETIVPQNAVPGYNDITVTKDGTVSNTFTYNVLSGEQNQIIFHVNAATDDGENVYIVGNIPELGNWDADECTEAMLNPEYPEWYLPVSVPAGTTIEFKFIKKDASGNVTWESGDNRVITSSSEDCGVIDTEVYIWR